MGRTRFKPTPKETPTFFKESKQGLEVLWKRKNCPTLVNINVAWFLTLKRTFGFSFLFLVYFLGLVEPLIQFREWFGTQPNIRLGLIPCKLHPIKTNDLLKLVPTLMKVGNFCKENLGKNIIMRINPNI
jgi:hypothetical protein